MQNGKIFRRGPSWHLRYKEYASVNGAMKWRTTSVRLGTFDKDHRTQESVAAEAKRVLAQINEVKSSAGHQAPTFREQALTWLSQCENRQRKKIKPSTLRSWRSHLNVHILPVFQNTPLPDVNNLAVKDFARGLQLQPKSVNNIVQVIKLVRASALSPEGEELYPIKWNHVFMDVAKVVSREQHTPAFTSDQINKLVKAGDRRMQILVVMFAATGLRAGEMFGLEIKHFNGHAVTVEQELWEGKIQSPKTENAFRIVELHPSVAALLRSFIGKRSSGFIFPNSTGKANIRQSNFLRREFHPLLKSLEIPRGGFYGFRRFRNTYLRNVADCPDGLLKYWLGNSMSADMSDRYDQIKSDSDLRRAQARKMGVGFKVPKRLKSAQNDRRFVVSHVVQNSQPAASNHQKTA